MDNSEFMRALVLARREQADWKTYGTYYQKWRRATVMRDCRLLRRHRNDTATASAWFEIMEGEEQEFPPE